MGSAMPLAARRFGAGNGQKSLFDNGLDGNSRVAGTAWSLAIASGGWVGKRATQRS